MANQVWPTGSVLANRFRVVRVLGQGGMGVVYEVIHELTHHRRALKTLGAQAREKQEAIDRFVREASAAGRIGNPHIVETFDAGVLESGEPYLVMELLEGETLAARMDRGPRLELFEMLEIFRQACEAVHAAHEAGIVHRDLKPENVFITRRGKRPFVKILDFGVSKFDPRHQLDRCTLEGMVVGTPFYMSPEQVRADDTLDGRSDVYALGVMLYECASGQHPYPAESLTQIIYKVLEATPRPLSEIATSLPPELDAICQRALRKAPEDRFQTARELGDAVASLLPARMVESIPAPQSAPLEHSDVNVPTLGAAAARSVPPGAPTGAATHAQSARITNAPESAPLHHAPARAGPKSASPKTKPARSLAQPLVGGVAGAAVVAIALAVLVSRTQPGGSAAPPTSASPVDSSAAALIAKEPSPPVTPTTEASSPLAPPSTSVSPSTSAFAPPSAPPSSSARTVVTTTAPKPLATSLPAAPPHNQDIAGKGEFKP